MVEISTSGLMSGDGKRSGVFRAQSPRPSSTLPHSLTVQVLCEYELSSPVRQGIFQ